MPTITIRVSRRESARIARLAKRRKTGKSQVVREAVARLDEAEPGSLLDAWSDVVGSIEGGPTDLATNPRHLKGFGR